MNSKNYLSLKMALENVDNKNSDVTKLYPYISRMRNKNQLAETIFDIKIQECY